jgi:hypothetical protein
MEKTTYLELQDEKGHGYLITVIEFQQRGLPHAHIAFRPSQSPARRKLKDGEKCAWVDHLVCAQYPTNANKDEIMKRFDLTHAEFARLQQIVPETMLHDKGNEHKTRSGKIWCHNDKGHCTKNFPKPYDPDQECSYVDKNGYVIYIRRTVQDSWVVPYNPRILLDFHCHCNVEIAGTVNIICYLYNYLYKGADTTKFFLDKYKSKYPNERDEIMEYRIARYLCASEAAIRILEIAMYICKPSVTSINVHLPIPPTVPRKGPSDLELYLSRPIDARFDTITLAGMTRNGTTEPGYFETFQLSATKPTEAYIKTRKRTNPNFQVYSSEITTNMGNGTTSGKTFYVYERQRRDRFVTRIQHVNTTIGEQFYARLIFLHTSPRSYEQAKTVNGKLHGTFQAAARAMGLLDDFNEAFMCLQEATVALCQQAEPLRRLFCILLREGWPLATVLTADSADPNFADYDTVKQALMSDYLAEERHPQKAFQKLLEYIHDYVTKNTSKTMQDYGLPDPPNVKSELDREELLYGSHATRALLHEAFTEMQKQWTTEFYEAFAMTKRVEAAGGGYCVIKGGGGVGKTTLTAALIAYFRAQNNIVRIAAPTALAATLHPGGVTFHDLFKLNIVETDKDEYTSFLDKHPHRQALLRECKVIFLDEGFATHLQNIKAAIKALQRVCGTTHETAHKVFVIVGDPLQIPPVVIDETSEQATVDAMVISLPSWEDIPKVTLTKFQRNQQINRTPNTQPLLQESQPGMSQHTPPPNKARRSLRFRQT